MYMCIVHCGTQNGTKWLLRQLLLHVLYNRSIFTVGLSITLMMYVI